MATQLAEGTLRDRVIADASRLSAHSSREQRSMLSLRLRAELKAIGAMGFVRHRKRDPYTQADQDFLMELADAVAAGLQQPSHQ
jgi:GAF domain-containing protein